MAHGFCHEYTCGCIIHHMAGKIRKCEGCVSRTLSGKMTSKSDGAEQRHNSAMGAEPIRTYIVADILP